MRTIDLNADLGEGGASDGPIMELVSSVNIACGGHAGDISSMQKSVELALETGAAIGAHPGYEDREHFGRRAMSLSPDKLRSVVSKQLERMLGIHPALHHVKLHGALYNQANQEEEIAESLVRAIAELLPDTILYCPPDGALSQAATDHGLSACGEGFIDRRYLENGQLCPRDKPGAVIEEPEVAVAQAIELATQHSITAIGHTKVNLKAQTLCVHGDSPNAIALLRLTRAALEKKQFRIAAP